MHPKIVHVPMSYEARALPSAFSPDFTEGSLQKEWVKERMIASSFAKDFDFYRAITAYKRALFLLPKEEKQLRLELHYEVVLCYYLANKFPKAVSYFENSELSGADSSFPVFDDLLVVLYDSYRNMGKKNKEDRIMEILKKCSKEKARKLQLSKALLSGDILGAKRLSYERRGGEEDWICSSLNGYESLKKSASRAKIYNALFPGLGYYYVGQKKTALTSFLLNTLFIAASYRFFDKGHISAGLIISSLEMGWYIGGIHGAGLAAREYNERLYESKVKDVLLQEKLFPFYILQHSF